MLVNMLWVVVFFLFYMFGEFYILLVGLGFFVWLVFWGMGVIVIVVWFLVFFGGNFLVGLVGCGWELFGLVGFFVLLVLIVGVVVVVLFVLWLLLWSVESVWVISGV